MKTFILLLTSLLFLNFSVINNDIEKVFSETKKIEIYAFYNFNKWDLNDVKNYFKNGKIVIPAKYLRNKVILDVNQILKLKSSLMEINYKEARISYCDNKLHSIVFYNKRNKAIGYVNICFKNNNSIPSKELESSERLVYGLFFQKELFKEFGITYFEETNEEREEINRINE